MRNILAIFILLIALTNGAYGINNHVYLETNKTNSKAYLEYASGVANFIMGITNVIQDYELAELISCDIQDVHDTCLLTKSDFVYDVLEHALELLHQKQWCDYFFIHSNFEWDQRYYSICQDKKNKFQICDYNLKLDVNAKNHMQSTHIKNTLYYIDDQYHNNDYYSLYDIDWFI